MNRRLYSVMAACFTLALLLGSTSSASAQTCAAAWSSTAVYTAGMTASESNINYVANWWTQGNDPATNNGVTGTGEPWTSQGACTSGTASCTTVPGALTLSASGTTNTATTLSWTVPTEGANCTLTGYEVYQGGVAKAAVAAGTTSYAVTGLTAGTAYSFYIAATNSDGAVDSNTLSVTTTSPSCSSAPAAPTALTASGTTSSGTTLSWTASTVGSGCSVSSYTITGGPSTVTSTGTSTTISGLAASTAYTFSVTATDAAGTSSAATVSVTTSSSGSSSTCAAAWVATTAYTAGMVASENGNNYTAAYWTEGNNPTTAGNSGAAGSGDPWSLPTACSSNACTSAPGAFTVSASGTTGTGTTLAWTVPTEGTSCTLTGYEVYQGGAAKAAVAAGTTSYAVSGLTAGTAYSFDIAATNADGTTTSNTLSVTTTGTNPCTAAPGVPTGLAASGTTSTGTTLSWAAVTPPSNCSITSYTVLRNGSSIGTTTGTSYTVSGLTASTSYSFTVEASDSEGTSSASPATSVTTLASTAGNGRVLVGYWHDWETPEWIQLRNVPTSWDIVVVAFANYNGNGQFSFTVDPDETQAQFISDVQYLHSLGKKVLISCGGATETPTFASSSDAANFASSVAAMMNQFGFDGVDIDFENGAVYLNQGDLNLANPTTPSVVYLISGLQQLHQALPNAMITMAPIANYVQAGYQYYGSGLYGASNWNGAQLPVINAIRGFLTYVWPQYYNEANIEALDGNYYSEGSEDNLVAMSEMLLKGFTVADGAGTFQPLNANQVVIGVPASTAASPGYLPPASLDAAFNYLTTGQNPVGAYVLQNSAGYPDVAGYMMWSINWDVYSNGGSVGSAVSTYLESLPPIN